MTVVAAGATGLRDMFEPQELVAIASCYMDGLSAVFVLAIALAGCASVISLLAPCVSIKGKVVAAI